MTELDDDRDEFGPDASAEDAGDPAAAFDALRETVENLAADLKREMTTIRKGVEAAFEEFDRQGPAQDYKPELAQIVRQLAHVGERVHGVEQSPILRQGAEHYAARLERAGEGLVKTAAQKLERQTADLERAGRNLSAYVASARERERQNLWLVVAFIGGMLAGALVMLFLPRALPFSAAQRVASLVMGETAWNAGMRLMAFDSSTSWDRVAAADQLIEANKAEVAACREAAAKAGKDQRCTITVAVPAPAPVRR